MKNIPESHQDLLTDEKRAFAFLGTLKADGTPQVTPVWFNTSGDYFLINSARGRLKDKNMRARPQCDFVHFRSGEPLPVFTNQWTGG